MEAEIKLLISKALDAVRISKDRNIPKFVGFLSPGEASAVLSATINEKCANFYGGYDTAERTVFGVLPDYLEGSLEAFPIKPIKIEFNKNFTLTHRDILGAFMSCGVSRSSVGDILIFEGYAIVFVLDEIANYFVNQIDKIKNVGVKLSITENLGQEISKNEKFSEFKFTVSSPRLDAIVSGLTGQSRMASERLVLDGLVFVNSFLVSKVTKKVLDGDVITVRGFGKFIVNANGSLSKKGREIISAKKYI